MRIEVTDPIWLNETDACSIEHLAEMSGLSLDELRELMEWGVITPVDVQAPAPSFHLNYVVVARTARRLREDFELDRHGTAVALMLLQRIHELETELQATVAVRGRVHTS
ncbi:chaperone modulator CbpM [Noviherbaspirillum massiliense]|uniref:chaperone modulator CbpM n=1 Tax=Noviherbaspirillum massiliense TaxID=1465823 RepID=UPI0002DC2A4F|nr:chaperone modulator CbpM [Noviherbaspirillum massiliense]